MKAEWQEVFDSLVDDEAFGAALLTLEDEDIHRFVAVIADVDDPHDQRIRENELALSADTIVELERRLLNERTLRVESGVQEVSIELLYDLTEDRPIDAWFDSCVVIRK